jgi:predicted N-acetyltransferase YhbS
MQTSAAYDEPPDGFVTAHDCATTRDWLPMATRTVAPVARSASSHQPSSSPAPVSSRRLRLALAKTGDHPSIHGLLVSVFHGPSSAEFQAQLDEPGYEPVDRVIVKDDDQIAAHLRLARQTIQVGSVTLPAARFMDLATAQAYRGRGLATALLAAGERAAAERGVLIGLTRTRVPMLFARQGWSVCGRHVFSTASPRSVLAELAAAATANADQSAAFMRPAAEPITVRPLRRIDLRAVVRLYEQHIAGGSGWPLRSEAYWEWLLARGACDKVYVASTPTESDDFERLLASIVGYVCVRQSRIVELIASPGRDDVARQLIERVCADAREQDGWAVRYDAPPGDSLHDLFRCAGGRLNMTQELGGELFMVKLLDPLAALRGLSDVLAQRSTAAGIGRPAEMGLELRSGGGRRMRGASGIVERYRLCIGRRGVRIETGGPSRHSMILAYHDLGPLLLGDMGAQAMGQARRAKFGTEKAERLSLALFPGGLWWRPTLDDLLA